MRRYGFVLATRPLSCFYPPMNQTLHPREHAMKLIAAYDQSGDPSDLEIVRIAHAWLSLIQTPEPVQHMIDDLLADLRDLGDDSCGWTSLKKGFLTWAKNEEWID